MKEFGNRFYYDTLEELVDPSRAALLVINMLNDQVSPGGKYDQKGTNVSMHQAIVPKIKPLIEAARKAKVVVVYLQHAVVRGLIEDSPVQVSLKVFLSADPDKVQEYHNIQVVVQGEVLLNKARESGSPPHAKAPVGEGLSAVNHPF